MIYNFYPAMSLIDSLGCPAAKSSTSQQKPRLAAG